jgi:hypothetical protein
VVRDLYMNVILTPDVKFAGDEEDVAIKSAVAVIRTDGKKSRGFSPIA